MNIKVTSPSGLWDYQNLIGASVKIKSLSVKAGFSYPSDELYRIESIGFRLSPAGYSYTVVRLEGIQNKEFVWKDLEVVGLRMPFWSPAICGMFCCGEAICGYTKASGECSGSRTPIRVDEVEVIRIERIALDETDLDAIERYFFGESPTPGQKVVVYGRGGDKEYILDPTFGWVVIDPTGNTSGIKIDNESIIKDSEDVYQVGTIDGGEI